jgi:cold shock CspA family protein
LLQEEDENELVQIEDNLLENELKRELNQGSKVHLHLHQDEDEPKQKSN